MVNIIQGHRCPDCKGPIEKLIIINKEKYGYDYEPYDDEEYYLYKCLNENCGTCDYSDHFYFWEVELQGEKCSKCGSSNLEGSYFDYFTGYLELKCKDCKHILEIE